LWLPWLLWLLIAVLRGPWLLSCLPLLLLRLLVLLLRLVTLLPVSSPRLRLLSSLRRRLVALLGNCLLLLLLMLLSLLLLPLLLPPRWTGPARVTFATFATFAAFATTTSASASVPPQTFERSIIAEFLRLREFSLQFHYLTRLEETQTVNKKLSGD